MNVFSPLNTAVLAVYFVSMLAIGALLMRRQKSTEDYFLAGRGMNWLIVGMSMFATLTSAVTYMGLPGMAYRDNIALIIVAFISPVVAPILVFVFYPFYRRLRITTSYEYIDRRFGREARFAVSGLFLLARLGWLGTVVYAPALALSVVTGMNLAVAILIMGMLATVYTMLGGIAADIWTDVVQYVIMLGGAIWLAVELLQGVPGGFGGIVEVARAAGAFDIWDVQLTAMSAPIVALTFFFKLMQDYGTDQTTVQRLMTIKTYRGMARATFFNALSDVLFISLLLFIGIGLLAYHTSFPDRLPDGLRPDQILPYFIIHSLPDGVSGLLITAIFAAAMSSMDSGINSLSTVIINDFVRPLRKTPRPDKADLDIARVLTFAFGAFATAIAFYVASFDNIIKAYSTIMSMFNAPILALFLLGIFWKRASFPAWLAGALVALAVNICIWRMTDVHWIYYFPLSLAITTAISVAAGLLLRPRPCDPALTIWGRGHGDPDAAPGAAPSRP